MGITQLQLLITAGITLILLITVLFFTNKYEKKQLKK